MKPTLVCMTYAGADHLCRAHFGNWQQMVDPERVVFAGADKEFWSPKGATRIRHGIDAYPDRASGSRDLNMPHRLTEALKFAAALPAKPVPVVIVEPDVWFWKPLTVQPGVEGRVFTEGDGRRFVHWPVIIEAARVNVVARTLQKAMLYGMSCNPWGSFPDRFLAAVLDLAGIPLQDYGRIVSHNTIDTEAKIQECLQCKAAGYMAVHGIKNQQVLERLL